MNYAEAYTCKAENVVETTGNCESLPDALPISTASPTPAPVPQQASETMESDSETEDETDKDEYIDTIIRDINALVARLRRSRDYERARRRNREKDLARANRKLSFLDGQVRDALSWLKGQNIKNNID